MRRSRTQPAITAFVAALSLGLTSAAWSQPAPSAKPSAKPSAAPSAKPSAKPSADPSAKPSAGPQADSALPPGHPSINPGLPQGHPPIDDSDGSDGSDDEAPTGAPPGHGHGATPDQAPEDTAIDDPSLPPGSFVITVKDGQDRVIPGAAITLGILHSSVAKGDSREETSRTTDEQGSVRFDAMTIGSGTQYRVVTTRGPARFEVGPFTLSDRQGKRVVLHAYEVTTDIENAPVGMQAIVYLQLREDSISVEHLFSVYNLGGVAWVPNVTITLPEGFKAFNKQDDAADVRVEEIAGKGAALRGTVGPGRHDVTFRYQVPLKNEEKQTLRIGLPPRVAQGRVMVEVSKTMGVEVTGFPAAQKSQNREGKRLLITDQQAARSEGGLRSFEITLTGLPTPGPGRWIAVILAALALIGGGAYMLQTKDITALPDDARDDLLDAREALLREIVDLERAHRRGDVGPKTYARVRGALLDSLARIIAMLEGDRTGTQTREAQASAKPASAAEPP